MIVVFFGAIMLGVFIYMLSQYKGDIAGLLLTPIAFTVALLAQSCFNLLTAYKNPEKENAIREEFDIKINQLTEKYKKILS
jgi:hypothetical protein